MPEGVNPAVVVVAYNRPDALSRLLNSLDAADYPNPVPLIISIDRGGTGISPAVSHIAEGFAWRYGSKRVIERREHLGVVGHFYACGDMTAELGSMVLLEDDLSVSPAYYGFASSALNAYGSDERIAGTCLYALSFNGFTQDPFLPIDDGSDVFFLALPYTQGLAFSAEQWAWFRGFDPAMPSKDNNRRLPMHPAFQRFPPDEWFPRLAEYVAASERYFCYPRSSLSTGWGDEGAHFDQASSWFQTPLKAAGGSFRLSNPEEALAVYDSYFEILPERLRRLGAGSNDGEFEVDLYATKAPGVARHSLILTSRPARRALRTYGLRMYPPELNFVYGVAGTEVSLARVEDVDWGWLGGLEARRRLDAYFWARRRPSRRRGLAFAFARMAERLRHR
jgi:hypothetical protein